MSDYISREETLERLCKDVCNVSDCKCDEARCEEWYVIHDIPAADAIEELICEVADEHNARLDAEERQRWIPVSERLPDEDDEVLVVAVNDFNHDDRWVSIDWLYSGMWQQHEIVTHWMRLPEPPKEE